MFPGRTRTAIRYHPGNPAVWRAANQIRGFPNPPRDGSGFSTCAVLRVEADMHRDPSVTAVCDNHHLLNALACSPLGSDVRRMPRTDMSRLRTGDDDRHRAHKPASGPIRLRLGFKCSRRDAQAITMVRTDHGDQERGGSLRMLCERHLATAWVRFCTLSLRRIFCTWFFTVSALMPRMRPISMLLLPSCTQRMIST